MRIHSQTSTLQGTWLPIHAGVKVSPCKLKAPDILRDIIETYIHVAFLVIYKYVPVLIRQAIYHVFCRSHQTSDGKTSGVAFK